ncbi:N-acetyltransferase [Rhizobium leguminosarum]|uniref:GNAT family N-acetyltransferase n=1 Tax=Rhizobium leguminosarum TaxID=384 RepID=UPI002E159182|nr:N-acetyltransferase [Rhizobium leguminosarum]
MAAVPDPVRACQSFVIDAERPSDVPAREALLDRAMGPNRRRKSSEKIRRGRMPAEGLALVARDGEGSVIATVRLWNVEAGRDAHGSPVPALLLGPLAVEGRMEGRGVGGALVRQAVSQARALGHGAILLVGDPAYYERFGFTAALTGMLAMPGPFERHRLLALELVEGWLFEAGGTISPSGRAARSQRAAA